MSYVKRVLQEGEEIRHTASIHWIVYWPGAALMILAAVIFVYGRNKDPSGIFWSVIAAAVALLALVLLFREWFKWWTTEIAVTNRRVIFKEGFIGRKTVEMHMDKIESVDVDQPVLGRILDYGTVTVRGTGSGFEPLPLVAAPIELRNCITGV
jgi:uncharacterized membrane protein YdbT with pleckstrin-like domain